MVEPHERDVVQLVECTVWDREVESSNLSVPTKIPYFLIDISRVSRKAGLTDCITH